MQSNIFELIDLLVKMSGSKSNIDELKADLDDTALNIEQTQNKLRSLEQDMSDDKYFDASNEIVDRNIKISLTKKIQKLNRIKNDIDKELEEVKAEENSLHNELSDIANEINNAKAYSSVIEDCDAPTDAFSKMLESEASRLEKLEAAKEELEAKYEKVQKKVEYLAISSNEISEKISRENERLIEVESSLSNIKSYVDTDAKEADEERFIEVKNSLDELSEHKANILEDPVYIANLIKEAIASDNKDDVESEFNHLVEKVKAIPYMELENGEIQIEMQKLNDELSKYDSEISQKVYQTLDAEFIEERISYLDDYNKKIKERIKELDERKKLITNENDLLSSKIYRAESQIEAIDKSLVDYQNYDFEDNELPKTVVQAAYNKLLDEKRNIYSIAEKYRQDLVLNLSELKEINHLIGLYEKEIESKDAEYDELNKLLSLNTTSKNILEEEKDKLALEKINEKILNLKYREQFTKSLSEILDEFEMLNSSLEFLDRKSRVIRNAVPLDEKESTPIEEIILEKPVITEPEEKINPVIVEEVQNIDINPIEEIKDVEPVKSEKLRVVEVIPLTDDVTEPKEEDNFMINDFQDDDYVDFNTAVSSVEAE